MDMTTWLADVDGKYIDRDGRYPARDPFQCWDLWADYAERVEGTPLAATYTNAAGSAEKGGTWHSGLACNVFHNAHRVPAIAARFDVLPPDAEARAGDVAFWERGGVYAGSHVAIVVQANAERLYCMSQNRGPHHDHAGYEVLTRRTLLGFLRPRSKATASSTRPIDPEELTMADIQEIKKHVEHVAKTQAAATRAHITKETDRIIAAISAEGGLTKRHIEHVAKTVPHLVRKG
jgi:hypothetical protein